MQIDEDAQSTHGFIGDALARQLDISLVDVEVSRHGKLIARGLGRLFNAKDGQVLFEVYCHLEADSGDGLMAFRNPAYNTVMHIDDFFEVVGYHRNTRYSAKFPHVHYFGDEKTGCRSGRIRFVPCLLSSTESAFAGEISSATALVTPLRHLEVAYGLQWTSTTIKGGRERRKVESNFFKQELDGFTYEFVLLSNELSEISVYTNGESKYSELRMRLNAWQSTLSVLCGYRVEAFGFKCIAGGTKTFHYLPEPSSKPSLLASPVPIDEREYGDAWTDFSAKMIGYLLSNPASPLMHQLDGCWDTGGNSRHIHELSVATAVEGLAYLVYEKSMKNVSEEQAFKEVRKRLVDYLCSDAFAKSDDVAIKRFQGVVVNAGYTTTRARIVSVLNHFGINEDPGELDAWTAVRNSLAHAKIADVSLYEKHVRYTACMNLLYKLLIGVVGYEGPRVALYPKEKQGRVLNRDGTDAQCREVPPPIQL